jgi:uncharacterized protein (UPF0179 family)
MTSRETRLINYERFNDVKMGHKEIITFVGTSYSEKGFKFYFYKPRTDICPESCRFYNPCMKNLEENTIYTILSVTNIEHSCPYEYHNEPMKLVKVIESDILILIESRRAYLGAQIEYAQIDCDFKDVCQYAKYCSPVHGLQPGTKIKIREIIQKIKDQNCPNSLTLVKIEKVK